jgi:hypothetical protein
VCFVCMCRCVDVCLKCAAIETRRRISHSSERALAARTGAVVVAGRRRRRRRRRRFITQFGQLTVFFTQRNLQALHAIVEFRRLALVIVGIHAFVVGLAQVQPLRALILPFNLHLFLRRPAELDLEVAQILLEQIDRAAVLGREGQSLVPLVDRRVELSAELGPDRDALGLLQNGGLMSRLGVDETLHKDGKRT